MNFQEHTLGVKIIGSYVAIEKANPFEDMSKYDFIYTDFLSSDWNGNYCYGSNIRVLNNQDYILINGWKLISLSFPGDWFGNTAHCELEDRFGNTIVIDGVGKAVYDSSYMHMVREALTKAFEFTKSTPCVEYKEILDGIELKREKLTIDDFHKLIEDVDNYISKYKKLKESFSEEEAATYASTIKEAVSKNISKLFSLDICID